jgi:DNA invertase Pin-like site-specific DNA recombinase
MYLRVASARRQDAGVIERQRAGCLRIAAEYRLTVVREYADLGRPARFNQQPGLQYLLDDLAKDRDIPYVVVWNYARLASDMTQLETVIRRIRSYGAQVVTPTGVEVAERFLQERDARNQERGE